MKHSLADEEAYREHFRRLRESKPARAYTPKKHKKQRSMRLARITRIHIIQIADLPRYHYEVWADYEGAPNELLQSNYIHGLRNAINMAIAKWGAHRVEIEWAYRAPHGKKRIIESVR